MSDPDCIEIQEDRKCYHCGTHEGQAEYLKEVPCDYGQGLLHCDECVETCGGCEKEFCALDLTNIDGGETYGVIRVCEECREEMLNEQ